tara:strand:- start:93 stop:566 length:474 start_codon:yes stop_codon:yes gene_type:complete
MNYYDKISKGYNELYKEEQLEKIKKLIKIIDKTKKTLDVGCGTAFYHTFFKNYTGIDNSKEMLKQSKANIKYSQAENIPFKDNSFEQVISISAFHNFKDHKKALKEIERISKNTIAITIIKRTPKLKYYKNLLKDFKQIDLGKDILFLKKTKTIKTQ